MTIHRYSIILCLFSCLVFFIDAAAQEMTHFVERLTTEEGLSSNKIKDITQDDNGFLWIATTDGLNRFDGTEVTQYYHRDNVNSIPHNYIYCLKKLPGNYLAIGTQAGLSFYDGNTGMFENFYYQQNNPLDPYNNIITRLETDNMGNLWAASSSCIFIFDKERKLKKVIPSPFTATDAANERLRFVEKILPLSKGNVLLYLYDGWQIYQAATNALTSLKDSPFAKELKFLNDISFPPQEQKFESYFPYAHVFKVYDQYFLCIKSSEDSLLLFDKQGRQISSCFFPFNKYPYILWSQQVVTFDSTRLLFLFHNYGLAAIAVTWHQGQPAIHEPPGLLFEKQEYGNALLDRQANWWLATTGEGLEKISPYKQSFTSSILVSSNSSAAIKYDVTYTAKHNNVLWVATYGEGLFEVDLLSGKQKQHRLIRTANDTWSNFIWNVRQVSPDTIWAGTQIGMFWYCISSKRNGRIPAYPGKPPALDSVAITTQFTDSRGWVWIGLGKGKGTCYFDTKSRRFTYYPANTAGGYPLRYPTNIAEDKKGNLWFVSDASGVLVYRNKNDGRFQTISLPPASQKLLNNLSCIYCVDDSTLWLGAITGGLIKFHISKGSAIIYGHEKGLGNSHISSIYEDRKKRLWLVTDGELSCFDPHTETFTNYSVKDGLPVKHPTAGFYYDTQDQRLYTGGNGAFFYFNPDVMNPNQPPQKTIITAMQVNGQPYMLFKNKRAEFKSWQNDITIQYSAIDLANGPGTKYAYSLVGEDTGWIMAGSQRQINFSRLAPGKYTFMVRASNSSGVWSKEMESISFRIRHPFTQTIWFYALILLAAGAVFYALSRFRLKQLMQTEQIRSEISKNLHDEVGSTLTNISLGSLLAQKQLHDENALNRILKRIYEDSQHVSQSMREIVWSINPQIDTLGESLPRMLHYASELLEAEDIELQAEIAPEIEGVKLSMKQRRDIYLIFKETVNNLAKHSKATQVIIKFHLNDKVLVMIVSDNGAGFDTKAPLINNGLRNMQERAQSHQWKLDIQSGPGAGTTITLKAQIA